MPTAWDDLGLTPSRKAPGRFGAHISDGWMLVVVPQGGIVAALAARAMAATLGDGSQRLRSLTVVFAGQVATGDVEIDVTVLRRGRSMSQLTATVRNPGSEAGLTALAVFGASRDGFEFFDIAPPDVPGPDGLRSSRDPAPPGIDFVFNRAPMPFWEEILESRPAIGRAPWESFEDGPAEVVEWYRFDDPPLDRNGALDWVGPIVMCDSMPGAVGQKIRPDGRMWFGPSADYTVQLFRPAQPGWLLAHNRARHAGDGYASVELTLWDPSDMQPVAYATQVMFFAFGR